MSLCRIVCKSLSLYEVVKSLLVFESKVNEHANQLKTRMKNAQALHANNLQRQFAPAVPAVPSGIKMRAAPIAPALAASRAQPSPSLRTPLEPEAFLVFFNSLSL